MHTLVTSLLIIWLIIPTGNLSERRLDAARCYGSNPCYACKNCSRCAHCNSGGSCGVCGGGHSSSAPIPPNYPGRRHNTSPKMPSNPLQSSPEKGSDINWSPNIDRVQVESSSSIIDNICYVTALRLHLRSAPNKQSASRALLVSGQRIRILARGLDGWHFIEVTKDGAGMVGYVSSRYVVCL